MKIFNIIGVFVCLSGLFFHASCKKREHNGNLSETNKFNIGNLSETEKRKLEITQELQEVAKKIDVANISKNEKNKTDVKNWLLKEKIFSLLIIMQENDTKCTDKSSYAFHIIKLHFLTLMYITLSNVDNKKDIVDLITNLADGKTVDFRVVV